MVLVKQKLSPDKEKKKKNFNQDQLITPIWRVQRTRKILSSQACILMELLHSPAAPRRIMRCLGVLRRRGQAKTERAPAVSSVAGSVLYLGGLGPLQQRREGLGFAALRLSGHPDHWPGVLFHALVTHGLDVDQERAVLSPCHSCKDTRGETDNWLNSDPFNMHCHARAVSRSLT